MTVDRRAFRAALAEVERTVSDVLADSRPPALVELDYLRETVLDYPCRGGKRLRPALVLWFCGLHAGDVSRARYLAAAVEIYHNWTLVHDDIIDRDETRRGVPTAHVRLSQVLGRRFARDMKTEGERVAMLAGDIQQGWAVETLCRSAEIGVDAALVLGLVSRLCGWVGPLLVTGETVDMEQAWRGDCTEAGIRRMLELKTGVLLRYCAEAGSVVGTGVCDWESEAVAAAGRFAAKTGLAFQLKDDLLGVFAEEDELGKPVGSDIREGKRTLLYARGLNLASATARERLLTFLGSPDIGKRELDEVRGILTGTGARQEIEDECRVLVDEACEALRRFPACLYRDLLEQWALFVVERRL